MEESYYGIENGPNDGESRIDGLGRHYVGITLGINCSEKAVKSGKAGVDRGPNNDSEG